MLPLIYRKRTSRRNSCGSYSHWGKPHSLISLCLEDVPASQNWTLKAKWIKENRTIVLHSSEIPPRSLVIKRMRIWNTAFSWNKTILWNYRYKFGSKVKPIFHLPAYDKQRCEEYPENKMNLTWSQVSRTFCWSSWMFPPFSQVAIYGACPPNKVFGNSKRGKCLDISLCLG